MFYSVILPVLRLYLIVPLNKYKINFILSLFCVYSVFSHYFQKTLQ